VSDRKVIALEKNMVSFRIYNGDRAAEIVNDLASSVLVDDVPGRDEACAYLTEAVEVGLPALDCHPKIGIVAVLVALEPRKVEPGGLDRFGPPFESDP
jgi:hypothetical protein